MYNEFPYSSYTPGSFGAYKPISNYKSSIPGIAKRGFTWDGFLNNAEKTLNVVNKAMPIYNQVKPMFRNMGTVFKIIGELNSSTPAVASALANTSSAASAAASTPTFFA